MSLYAAACSPQGYLPADWFSTVPSWGWELQAMLALSRSGGRNYQSGRAPAHLSALLAQRFSKGGLGEESWLGCLQDHIHHSC